MMVAYDLAPDLAGLRQASQRWVQRERARARIATGVAALDAPLGGGWPQGKVGELVGPASSGRSAAAVATTAAATARGEVTAWIDPDGAFDPASAAAAGVDLERVLWVRPRGIGEAVRAAELVLGTGGFTVVVLDLGAAAAIARERNGASRGALALRLARATERAGAVALVLAGRPWAGTLAGVTVALARGEARWGGAQDGPRWFAGLTLRAQVERGRGREWGAGEKRAAAGGGKPRPYTVEADDSDVGAALAAARDGDRCVGATAGGTRSGGDKPRPYTVEADDPDVGAALAAARDGDRCVGATAGGTRSGGGKPRPYTVEADDSDVGAALAAARGWAEAGARPLSHIAQEREALGA